jgi:hypothetical protein
MDEKKRISEYKIRNHLIEYREANPKFEVSPKDSKWVLKNRKDNLISESYYEELVSFYDDIDKRGLIHTWFQSLKSSQAMAINFFGALSCEQNILLKVLSEYDCSINQKENMTPYFEYIESDDILGGNSEHFDKTNFDFVLKTNSTPIFFEFKYTEEDFGEKNENDIINHDKKKNLSKKDNYQYKFSALYKRLLEDLGVKIETFGEFYKDYQIWRNITYTKYGHVFFAFPEYREDLADAINNCLDKMSDSFYKSRVHIIYTDKVAKNLVNNSNKKIAKHFAEFWRKYFGFLD